MSNTSEPSKEVDFLLRCYLKLDAWDIDKYYDSSRVNIEIPSNIDDIMYMMSSIDDSIYRYAIMYLMTDLELYLKEFKEAIGRSISFIGELTRMEKLAVDHIKNTMFIEKYMRNIETMQNLINNRKTSIKLSDKPKDIVSKNISMNGVELVHLTDGVSRDV
jgi:hypothetical protein